MLQHKPTPDETLLGIDHDTVPTHVTDCPTCESTVVDGQGVLSCPDCDWAGIVG
jgi:hypothetical protein